MGHLKTRRLWPIPLPDQCIPNLNESGSFLEIRGRGEQPKVKSKASSSRVITRITLDVSFDHLLATYLYTSYWRVGKFLTNSNRQSSYSLYTLIKFAYCLFQLSGRCFRHPLTRADGNKLGQVDETEGNFSRTLKPNCDAISKSSKTHFLNDFGNTTSYPIQHHTRAGFNETFRMRLLDAYPREINNFMIMLNFYFFLESITLKHKGQNCN